MSKRRVTATNTGPRSAGTRRNAVERLANEHETALPALEGFDEAILGVAEQGGRLFVVYDRAKVLAELLAQGMAPMEAAEYYAFNILGADLGDSTPAFLLRVGEPHVH